MGKSTEPTIKRIRPPQCRNFSVNGGNQGIVSCRLLARVSSAFIFLSGFFVSGGPTTQKKEELLINLLSNRKGSVEYAKNMTSKDDGGDPNDPP